MWLISLSSMITSGLRWKELEEGGPEARRGPLSDPRQLTVLGDGGVGTAGHSGQAHFPTPASAVLVLCSL